MIFGNDDLAYGPEEREREFAASVHNPPRELRKQ